MGFFRYFEKTLIIINFMHGRCISNFLECQNISLDGGEKSGTSRQDVECGIKISWLEQHVLISLKVVRDNFETKGRVRDEKRANHSYSVTEEINFPFDDVSKHR